MAGGSSKGSSGVAAVLAARRTRVLLPRGRGFRRLAAGVNFRDDFELGRLEESREPGALDLPHGNDPRLFTETFAQDCPRLPRRMLTTKR